MEHFGEHIQFQLRLPGGRPCPYHLLPHIDLWPETNEPKNEEKNISTVKPGSSHKSQPHTHTIFAANSCDGVHWAWTDWKQRNRREREKIKENATKRELILVNVLLSDDLLRIERSGSIRHDSCVRFLLTSHLSIHSLRLLFWFEHLIIATNHCGSLGTSFSCISFSFRTLNVNDLNVTSTFCVRKV